MKAHLRQCVSEVATPHLSIFMTEFHLLIRGFVHTSSETIAYLVIAFYPINT